MKKMLRIMAILIAIATVVFVAGCASEGPKGTENETPEAGVTETGGNVTEGNITEGNVTVEGNATIIAGNETNVSANNTTIVA